MTALVSECDGPGSVEIPDWGLRCGFGDADSGIGAAIQLILRELEIRAGDFDIVVRSSLPRAVGLGSSAALAVAIIRALARSQGIEVDDRRVNEIAFECEKLAHGTPSGVDNTVATYSRPVLFRNDDELTVATVDLAEAPPLVVASSSQRGVTHRQVSGVRGRYDENRRAYDEIFGQMDTLSVEGAAALERGDFQTLGAFMNVCQGLLNAIEVSTPELERMIAIARSAGAAGAKLTGAGGGGSIVALCPGTTGPVAQALQAAGYDTLQLNIDG